MLECGVVACGAAGRVVVVNHEAQRLLGRDRGPMGPDGPLQRALRGGTPARCAARYPPARGAAVLEASAEAVTAADGTVFGAMMVLTGRPSW